MRQRSLSSVGVVLVGLVPAILGGPVFAVTMALLGLVAVREYSVMASRIGSRPLPIGYPVVVGFATVALVGGREQAGLAMVAIAIGLPLMAAIVRYGEEQPSAVLDWGLAAAGSLWIGIPVFSAVALRETGGTVNAGWLRDLAHVASWQNGAPRGLAWLLTIILITWLGDTGAYLVGRSLGRHRLLPAVSPKKTLEGAAGGLFGSGIVGAASTALFGLGVAWWWGILIGISLGALGQVGDLAESMMKREAGVKDSGSLIPGHGGVLDRIDALLFTLTGGWFLAAAVDRVIQ